MTRGVTGLIDFVKSIRMVLLSYLSKTSTISNPNIQVTKDGIPKALGALIPIVRKLDLPLFERIMPFLNTVLWSTRSLKTKADPSLKSITGLALSSNYRNILIEVSSF